MSEMFGVPWIVVALASSPAPDVAGLPPWTPAPADDMAEQPGPGPTDAETAPAAKDMPEEAPAVQAQEASSPRRGRPMEITGWTLTGFGTLLSVAGLGIVAWEQITNRTCTPDPITRECGTEGYGTLLLGMPLLAAGGVFAAVGLPLAKIGRRRQTEPPPAPSDRGGPGGRSPVLATGTAGWVILGLGAATVLGGAGWAASDPGIVEMSGPIVGLGALAVGGGASLGVTGRRRALAREDRVPIDRARERERAGWIMTGIGGAAVVIGAVVIAADSDKWGVKQVGRFVGGSLATAGGLLSVVGIPLGVSGRRQRPVASRGLPSLSLAPAFFGHGGGLGVRGQF